MSTPTFTLKRTARLPSREFTLSGNGLTTLAGVDTVTLVYGPPGGGAVNTIAATITDAAAMKVRVDFGSVDVATLGTYQFHFKATTGGLDMYFPDKGFMTFQITPTLE